MTSAAPFENASGPEADDQLFVGRSVTTVGDPLVPVKLAQVIARIRNPKPETADLIRQLRALRTIDKKRYDAQKKALPYLVCGHFRPAIRRKEHFHKISNFMLDLDGISGHADVGTLRRKLQADPQVLALFASPGGDGLKVVFRLQSPCFDAGLYAAFYKIFSRQFARRHGIEDITDFVTSDVSRACFVSWDEDAWLNPIPEAVDLAQYANEAQPDELLATVNALEKEAPFAAAPKEKAPKGEAPAPDVLQAIRQKLNPDGARKGPAAKQYAQPPQLDENVPAIRAGLEALGITLAEVSPIHHGKRLKVVAAPYWAEVNIYFGGRGWTCVPTTKTASNAALAQLAKTALDGIFMQLGNG